MKTQVGDQHGRGETHHVGSSSRVVGGNHCSYSAEKAVTGMNDIIILGMNIVIFMIFSFVLVE